MMDNILQFPQTSEIDKQFLQLEKQRELIRQQKKLIAEKNNEQ
tara:strand:- start:133 stop:261 length:129 start_codon:yes stop_codon:yes gene_type:complete